MSSIPSSLPLTPSTSAVLDEKLEAEISSELNFKKLLEKTRDSSAASSSPASSALLAKSQSSPSSSQKYTNENREMFFKGLSKLYQLKVHIDVLVSSTFGAKVLKDFPAHKIILASHSPYLLSKIKEAEASPKNFNESGQLLLQLNDIHAGVLERMMLFMYTGEVVLSDDIVVEMFNATYRLGIEDLQRLCEEHVSNHITTDTVFPLLLDANCLKATRLNEKCLQFIKKNIVVLFDQQIEQVLQLPKKCLVDILQTDFKMDEHAVFRIVKKWGDARQALYASKFPGETVPPLKEILSGIVEYIHFVSLKKKFLQKEVIPLDILPEDMLIRILFHRAKDPSYLQFESTSGAAPVVAPAVSAAAIGTGANHGTGANANSGANSIPDASIIDAQNGSGDEDEKHLPAWLRPRGNVWKTMADFANEEAYATYLKAVLRPGMLMKAIRSYENVSEGDIGEFQQWNTGFPPCQVRWRGFGSTYWLHWRDLVIVEEA